MSKLTKRITAMLLSGMLAIGSASGSVYAAAADVDPGLTTEIAEEVFTEEPVETAESPAESAQTFEVAEEVFPEEESAENAETPVNPSQIPGAAPLEEAITSYTVTLDANGGYFKNEWDDSIGDYVEQAEMVEKQIPVGGTVTAVPVFVDTDGRSRAFAGWSLERDGELVSTGDEEYAPVGNCALYAVWKTVMVPEEESWEEVEDNESERIDPIKAAQGTEKAEEAEKAIVEAESPVEEVFPDLFVAQENEDEQAVAPNEDADYIDGQEEEIKEASLDSFVAQKKADPTSIEGEECDEEISREEVAMEVVTSGTCGEKLTWTLDEEGTLTISGEGEMEDYGSSNPPWTKYMKKVIINNGVTRIGIGAFANCIMLNSVIISNSVTSIGSSAFEFCGDLENITIPSGVTSIGSFAFAYCSNIKKITIPANITRIRNSVFEGCQGLTNISIPVNVTTIDDYAFYDCAKLSSIEIPNTVTRIGHSAFSGCNSLVNITIPNSVISFGENVFSNCKSLTDVVLPETITCIEWAMFSGCSSLTSITLPDSIKSIEENAFEGCTSLTSIVIPDGTLTIYNNAFHNCKHLSSVFIPSTVWGLDGGNFLYYNDRTGEDEAIPGLTIIGYKGTEAQKYANRYNILFKSLSIPISGADIKVPDQIYTGRKMMPAVTVYFNGIQLRESYDYTVSYRDNINAGTAKVIITGKIKYEGTEEASFKIHKASQSIITANLSLYYPKSGKIIASKNQGTLSYKSSNTAVATVDSTGKVTAKGAGTAKITITAAETDNYDAATKTINVTVAKGTQTITAKAAASRIAVGKTTTVSITGNKGAKSFKSSDTTIATVDKSTGKVTAKKVGTVKITATSAATANYNAASKTVTIKVVPAATASLRADNQATGIKLTWKKVTGTNGYKIYRGLTLIKTITSGNTVTYADTKANTNGTKYTYKVVAKAATGDSTLSKSVAVYRVARPAVSSVTNSAASKMTVKWGKNAKATGYQIQYSTDKSFKSGNKAVTVAGASSVSKVIGNLTKSKTYYVRIRSYKKVGNRYYWSAWSPAKTVKITK